MEFVVKMSVLRDFGNQFVVGSSPLAALRNMMESKIPPAAGLHHGNHHQQYADFMDFTSAHLRHRHQQHHYQPSSRFPVVSSSSSSVDCLGLHRSGPTLSVAGREDCCATLYNLLQYSRARPQSFQMPPISSTSSSCSRSLGQLDATQKSTVSATSSSSEDVRRFQCSTTTVGLQSDNTLHSVDQQSTMQSLGLHDLVSAGLRSKDHRIGADSWPGKIRQPTFDWSVNTGRIIKLIRRSI